MSDASGPGERPPAPAGGEQRRLDRAPGERYAAASASPGASVPAAAPARRAVIAAVLVADACALLFTMLAQVDLGIGMLVVAAFAGWVVGLALVWWGREAIPVARARIAIAAAIGASSIVIGLALDWAWSLFQGGALGPVDYVIQRFGAVGLLAIAVASGVAAWRAR
jgi:hypothetical protein